jgi:hypothetical protein
MSSSKDKDHGTGEEPQSTLNHTGEHESHDWYYLEGYEEISGCNLLGSKHEDWPLRVCISKRFELTQPIAELPRVSHDPYSFRFEVCLAKRQKPEKRSSARSIEDIAFFMGWMSNSRSVSTIESTFREIGDQSPILTIVITAATGLERLVDWNFGFNFDLSDKIKKKTLSRVTRMIHSVKAPTMDRALELTTDEQLGVDELCDLGGERLIEIKGSVSWGKPAMWRLAAVGYKADKAAEGLGEGGGAGVEEVVKV